jgi:sugar lactone lactonase YvrE
MNVDVAVTKKCELGEGTWWDPDLRQLYWFDGFGNELYLYDPGTGKNRTFPINSKIGCVIPTKTSGTLVLCLQDGVYLFNTENKELRRICDVEREIENNRLNDGGCDSKGTLWFGSMSMTANQEDREFEVTGSFYSLTPGGELKKYFDGVGISNGIAWNNDETLMYYVDSTTQCVFSYRFDAEKREISDKRVIVEIPTGEGIPDGMTIDAEGMLWVAHFGGGRVSRWDPRSSRRLEEITLPVTNVTCCCFAGTELTDMYITTARTGLTAKQLENEPLAGSLFHVRPGVKGTLRHYRVQL